MAKTNEELQALKARIDELREELSELTEEELREVSGGILPIFKPQIPTNNNPDEKEPTKKSVLSSSIGKVM